ncbi:hypothetical protein FN846DRAFT_1008696 [Sphaerosporella brunnea]|uniref:RNase H type-1 domain-containing protein n=1 Tax=Sphaerosporella brunnea TaxID=1250544 RepID=A0A5J5ECR4_9PEZI|nr:hypothetical protein FN846DRAFT_1008696 [Sphaerosporella brunnea]
MSSNTPNGKTHSQSGKGKRREAMPTIKTTKRAQKQDGTSQRCKPAPTISQNPHAGTDPGSFPRRQPSRLKAPRARTGYPKWLLEGFGSRLLRLRGSRLLETLGPVKGAECTCITLVGVFRPVSVHAGIGRPTTERTAYHACLSLCCSAPWSFASATNYQKTCVQSEGESHEEEPANENDETEQVIKTRAADVQKIINKQAKATTGMFKSARIAIALAESQMYPAEAIIQGRIERFWAKLAAKPTIPGEENRREVANMSNRGERSFEDIEVTVPQKGERTRGTIIVEEKGVALHSATYVDESDATMLWTDGSRVDGGHVGAAVAWYSKEAEDYVGDRWYLGNNKEVFDAELFAVVQAIKIAAKREQIINDKVVVWTDSQATLTRIWDDSQGPGQAMTRWLYRCEKELIDKGAAIE